VGQALRVGIVLASCLLTAAPGRTQGVTPASAAPAPPPPQATQPVTGFVSSYEIAKIARTAGFEPLAPPLREGTAYVLRATDFRGALMRVVIDARSGAIRDVTHIVPGPGRYGQYASMPSPYDGMEFDAPSMMPSEAEMAPSPPIRATLPHGVTHSVLPALPPLPRPRPAALIAQHNAAAATASPAGSAAAPAAPKKPPAPVEPLND
jgi:hypothetical protein